MDNQFTLSAYHNYLVNGLLVAGFQLGKAGKDRFFFQALPIENENCEPQPLISANLFDSEGKLILQIDKSVVVQNPDRLKFRKAKAGLSIRTRNGSPFFSFETIAFRNSHCTRFAGNLFDELGNLVASGVWRDFVIHENVPVLQLTQPI